MKFTGAIEFSILEHSAECVVGAMPVQSGILNPFGVLHAGAMLWFADVCATALVAGITEFLPAAASLPLGINLNANLTGTQQNGTLQATSQFVKRGRRLSVVRTRIIGEGGQLIAEVTTSHIPAQEASEPGVSEKSK